MHISLSAVLWSVLPNFIIASRYCYLISSSVPLPHLGSDSIGMVRNHTEQNYGFLKQWATFFSFSITASVEVAETDIAGSKAISLLAPVTSCKIAFRKTTVTFSPISNTIVEFPPTTHPHPRSPEALLFFIYLS